MPESMKKRLIIYAGLLMCIHAVSAQEIKLLTVDEAVGIAMMNNFDIVVARNNADIARINNTLGNAGMLPAVSLTGTDNYSLSNVNQQLVSGTTIERTNGYSNSFNAAVALSWNLFDGTKMFITKNKLGQIEKLGEIQFRDLVQQSVYNVIVAYYTVVSQKQQLQSINEVMAYNIERVKILQKSFDAGLGRKTDLLQAKIDLNVNRELEINQKTVISNSKHSLNELLSRDPLTPFEVGDSIPLNYTPDVKGLIQKLYTANTGILSYQKQVDIARLSLSEYKTLYMPRLNFNAAYNFLQSNSNASQVLSNRSYGPQLGGSLVMPLYQAGNVSRQVKSARIQASSAQIGLESIKLRMNTELQRALIDFDDQQQLLKYEKENYTLAKENLNISLERLRLGQTTALEVRQASESFANCLARLVSFQYNLKISETRLKQLVAEL
jgi:outer membrane protein